MLRFRGSFLGSGNRASTLPTGSPVPSLPVLWLGLEATVAPVCVRPTHPGVLAPTGCARPLSPVSASALRVSSGLPVFMGSPVTGGGGSAHWGGEALLPCKESNILLVCIQ